jgi:hypothetical protein
MKRTITSASLAALGVVSLQAAYAPGLSEQEQAKPWSVSASLRGFYDDNYTTLPEHRTDGGPTARNSFGFDLSPRVSINLPMDTTLFSFDYIFDMRYYENRENNSADYSHQFTAKVDHSFSENYKLDLSDSFVIAQEPEILDPTFAFPLRANGNNMANTANATFHAQMTRLLGAEIAYSNALWAYDQKGFAGSYSSLLDRMQHLVRADLRWTALEQSVLILGYQFGLVDYTSPLDTTVGLAKFRDSRSHYVYVGVDQNFTPQLNGSLRVGAQVTDFPNANLYTGPGPALDDSSVIPYADASLSYTYTKGSYIQVGVKHTYVQTDILALNQEATTLYASVNHQITAKLMGSLLGTWQHGSFNQGQFDSKDEDYFSVGLNLNYQINQYFSAETGYNLDRLSSGVLNRSFTRNRVYLGVRASY